MKKVAVSAIVFYQKYVTVLLQNLFGLKNTCRFETSCSVYTKRSIQKYGVLKGVAMGIRRIFSCQPFGPRELKLGSI